MQIPVLIAFAALSTTSATPPTTWYVRTDGASPARCDGRHDAPYPGHGENQRCAWRHPFDALPPGGPARIAGGDTLLIGPGDYRMGRGAPATQKLEKCRADWPWDCHAAAPPSGPSPAQPTRIAGAGWDRGCRAPPQLWGAERASTVLDLGGSSNVELACLEITDHSSCIEFHNAPRQAARCERDHAPYGDWAATGIVAADSANVLLRDVAIHGLAHDGIRAGRLRDWTLDHVRLSGNGWAGWNGDLGGGDAGDHGRMVFRDVEIAWNGCGERWPGGAHFGCWGQEEGGYGDGLGTSGTGGDWLFERVDAHDNTQDGIDLLHARPDAKITFRDVHARGNAGNQIKAQGAITVEKSTIDGDCAALSEHAGLPAADACRARGNSLSLHLAPDVRARVVASTISGEGDCLIGLECAKGGCAGASAAIEGNHLDGAVRSGGGEAARAPCALWIEPKLDRDAVHFAGNTVRGTRNAGCPAAGATCDSNHWK